MAKDKKTKKTKVKKIANVVQRVIVNVTPSKSRSKNAKSYGTNGFDLFLAKSRMMMELQNMPNQIKQIVSERRNESNSFLEDQFQQLSVTQDSMKKQILSRVEKQSLDKYLQNIGGFIDKDIKQIKSGAQDFESGIPIV